MSASNPYLLLAGIAKATLTSIRNNSSIPVNLTEQTYALLQAYGELLAGGAPTIEAINTVAAGLNDLVQLRYAPVTLTPDSSGTGYAPRYVYDATVYGADPTGSVDSSAAILAANAAAASSLHGQLYIPPGQYLYNSATPITVQDDVVPLCYGTLIGGTNSTDCWLYSGANSAEGEGILGSVINFLNGAGVRFLNTYLGNVSGNAFDNNLYDVLFEGNGGSCYDNAVTAGRLAGADGTSTQTSTGVAYKATGNSDSVSGNSVTVNTLAGNLRQVAFITPTGSTISATLLENIINAGIITGNGYTNAIGIYCSPYLSPTNNIISCGYFGANPGGDVLWQSGATGNVLQAFIDAANGFAYSRYTMGGAGNSVQIRNPGAHVASIAAATSAGSVASWNGGTAVAVQIIPLTYTVSGLASGNSVSIYCYSPFLNGSTPVFAAIQSASATAPLTIAAIDNSGTNANEIKITLTNASGSTITSSALVLNVRIGY